MFRLAVWLNCVPRVLFSLRPAPGGGALPGWLVQQGGGGRVTGQSTAPRQRPGYIVPTPDVPLSSQIKLSATLHFSLFPCSSGALFASRHCLQPSLG